MRWQVPAAGLVVVIVALACIMAIQIDRKGDLLDHMVERSLAVDAVVVNQGWEEVSESSVSYRPWCISYRCPAVARTYLVSLAADEPVGGHIVPLLLLLLDAAEPVASESISGLAVGEWYQPTRPCVAGANCAFSGRSSRFEFNIVAGPPTLPAASDRGVTDGRVLVQIHVNIS